MSLAEVEAQTRIDAYDAGLVAGLVTKGRTA